jgi:hypothetical protein
MRPLTLIVNYVSESWLRSTVFPLAKSGLIEEVVVICQEKINIIMPRVRIVIGGGIQSQDILSRLMDEIKTRYALFLTGPGQVVIGPNALEKLLSSTESTQAGITYSDYYEMIDDEKVYHPLNDYQTGSVRDDFDFGGIMLFSTAAVKGALKKHGVVPNIGHGGFYDLRLKVSIDSTVYHIREPLYTINGIVENMTSDNKLFAYIDPRNASGQREKEVVFTDFLKKIGAYIHPGRLQHVGQAMEPFPFEASVVIPVRNRSGTITDAVKSALSQETEFSFNVIVVDNHSTDGTTQILSSLAIQHAGLVHIIPQRTDLGIGGCWNEAINASLCGRYAVQLDSDDLYGTPGTLQRIVDTLRTGKYAMVIGSYTIVNSRMEEIPPGLVDHREWTDENGHNNALRVNGLGAPRAFDTNIIRTIGFLNVSYGEDYAAALSICREYKIGRIFESLYLCRRWEGNTDAVLTVEESNRNNAFKDSIRAKEIVARQKMNKGADV